MYLWISHCFLLLSQLVDNYILLVTEQASQSSQKSFNTNSESTEFHSVICYVTQPTQRPLDWPETLHSNLHPLTAYILLIQQNTSWIMNSAFSWCQCQTEITGKENYRLNILHRYECTNLSLVLVSTLQQCTKKIINLDNMEFISGVQNYFSIQKIIIVIHPISFKINDYLHR